VVNERLFLLLISQPKDQLISRHDFTSFRGSGSTSIRG